MDTQNDHSRDAGGGIPSGDWQDRPTHIVDTVGIVKSLTTRWPRWHSDSEKFSSGAQASK